MRGWTFSGFPNRISRGTSGTGGTESAVMAPRPTTPPPPRLRRDGRLHDEVDHRPQVSGPRPHPALAVGGGPFGQSAPDELRYLVPVAELDQHRPEPLQQPADQLPGGHRRPGRDVDEVGADSVAGRSPGGGPDELGPDTPDRRAGGGSGLPDGGHRQRP